MAAEKFLFDTQFDAPPPEPEPEVVQEIIPEVPPEPPAPTFSEAELEDAKKRAWDDAMAEGLRQGRTEALTGIEQVQAKLSESLIAKVTDLLAEQVARAAQQREMVLRVALSIARKLLPAYAEKNGLAEIEALVTRIAADLGDEPRLVVRVADSQLDVVTARIQKVVEQRGFEGKLVFMGEPALGTSDCLIEWADGGAERNTERLWGEIDRIVAQALQGQTASAVATDSNNGTTRIES